MGVIALIAAAWLAQPPAEGATEEGREISSVSLDLSAVPDAKSQARLRELVTLRRGQLLSRRAAQRAIETLYASGLLSDVEVRVSEGPGGIEVLLVVTPRLAIGDVYVEGAGAFPRNTVVGASGLQTGHEYWPERVTEAGEAVAELYRRHGYFGVKVEPVATLRDAAMDVGFHVLEGAPTRLQGLSFAGDPGVTLSEALEAVALRGGEVVDLDVLERGLEALRTLLRERRFFRAKVETPLVLPAGRVVIPVEAGPAYEVRFVGNRSIPDTALRAVLGWDGQETLDETLADRLSARVARYYRFRGFADVRVVARDLSDPTGRRATLDFQVSEGRPLRVVSLDFEGNRAISANELGDLLGRVVQSQSQVSEVTLEHSMGDPLDLEGRMSTVFARSVPRPRRDSVFEEEAWREALRSMSSLYRERGYLSARVALQRLEVEGGQGRAFFVVHEGERAGFRSVVARGLPDGIASGAVEGVRPGKVFSVDALEQVRQDLVRDLGRQGYLFAAVEAGYTLDASGKHVDCVLTADVGPQVRVRKVVPVGNSRTVDSVILSKATMAEGQVLDAEALYQTQSRLTQLEIFRGVEVEMLAPEIQEPLKTVLLKVREGPRAVYGWAVGYYTNEGPRISGDIEAHNLFGRAVNLDGHAQLNWFALSTAAGTSPRVAAAAADTAFPLGGRATVSLQNRGLLPSDIGLRFDTVAERVFRPLFNFSRAAAVAGLDWSSPVSVDRRGSVSPKVTLQLQYELEGTSVDRAESLKTQALPLSLIDQQRLRFSDGKFWLHTARFTPTLDLRDDARVPHQGALLQASAEYTGSLAAWDALDRPVGVSFAKLSAQASGYIPLGRSTVLAMSLRGGRIFALASGSITPSVKRFFMGGANSLRGFSEDQVLPQDVRAGYREEVRSCVALALRDGCTPAALSVLEGQPIISEGGELFALFKAELRLPAFSAFELGIFFEAGNLWLSLPRDGLPLRSVAGAGLRWMSPVGPLAFDMGFNLLRDTELLEQPFALHFSITYF